MAKTGRPRKQIDQKQFENLCGLQCTLDEICAWFDTTDKTLDTWCNRTYGMGFSDIYPLKKGMGKISLRRTQWRLAESSAAMAIFLGKNLLGQRDTIEIDNTNRRNELKEIFNEVGAGAYDASKTFEEQ